MARVSTFTRMEATILVTGQKEKCKGRGSCLTVMGTYSIKVSGGMTTLREKVNYSTTRMVKSGTSTRVSSDQAVEMDLGSCSTRMGTGLRGNLGATSCGDRGECLIKEVL
jgi:hypothetical protein